MLTEKELRRIEESAKEQQANPKDALALVARIRDLEARVEALTLIQDKGEEFNRIYENRMDILIEALEFYASPNTWVHQQIGIEATTHAARDEGFAAKEALKATKR